MLHHHIERSLCRHIGDLSGMITSESMPLLEKLAGLDRFLRIPYSPSNPVAVLQ